METKPRKKTRTTIWDLDREDTYVRSFGGISTEWDGELETKQHVKRMVRVNGMI